MGIVLDSSVLVAAERSNRTPRQVIAGLEEALGDQAATLSVVTVIELSHGIERADSVERRIRRQHFLGELLREFSTVSVTVPIALRAGHIDGMLQSQGRGIALADLLIGATALELGYEVVTHNVRHFDRIPDLQVRRL